MPGGLLESHPISPAPLVRRSSSCRWRRPHPLCANAATHARPALLPLPPAKPWTSAGTLGPALLHLPFDPHRYRSTEYKLDGACANSTWLGHHCCEVAEEPAGRGWSKIGPGGGAKLRDLERGVGILVATPDRLADLMETTRISLQAICYLALVKADRMLDMGFEPQLEELLSKWTCHFQVSSGQ
ncbi:unnamed protein product [Miscanthus lutarioriparius]|uniref:DEAD/DEAH-box helicase domain-containing protein n=1 Tax=Miscanthus lutarioriparius TaxID=422564 RepID=A0A811PKI8_9POAL|nr:unnamed protein product [Miscanthus lutarioriparius]